MPTLSEVRKKYPQYEDLSDADLADGLYRSFYSDMPREEFDAKMGGVAEPEKPRAREMGITEYTTQALPFGDEVGAAGAATGKTIVKALKGEEIDWMGDYRAARESDAPSREQFAEEHPVQAGVGTTAAVLASGRSGAAPVAAPTLAGRAFQGAKSGAVIGGLYGAGEGEGFAERGMNAATGAVIGGGAGAVAAPLVEGAIAAGGAVNKHIVAPIRGAMNPDKEAARRVVSALEIDGGPNAAQRGAGLLDAAVTEDVPLVVADTGGEMTRALMRSAANTSPEARAAIDGATGERFAAQSERARGVIQDITGATGDTAGLLERLQTVAKNVNQRAYGNVFRQARGVGVWDDELDRLVQAPSVQDAIRKSSRTGRNREAVDRMDLPANPFVIRNGETLLKSEQEMPTLQFWDFVKRNLDDEIGTLQRAGAKSAAADAIILKNRIVGKMDEMFPAYRDARRGAAAFFDAEDALEAGTKFVTSPMENAEARRILASMSAAERELFKHGYANELTRRVGGLSDTRDVAKVSLFHSPQARERMDIVFGKTGARRMEAFVEVERVMNRTKEALGNSTTARQLVEAGLAGGTAGFYQGGDWTSVTAGAVLGMAMRRGYNLIDSKVATRVGQMLASEDPDVLRKAVNMISRNPRLLEALRAGEEYIGRLVAPSGADVGSRAIPAMIPGRAEDEQQPINGM